MQDEQEEAQEQTGHAATISAMTDAIRRRRRRIASSGGGIAAACSHEAVQERLLRLLPLVQLPAVSARFERLILVPCERWVNLPTFRRGQKAPQVLLLDNTRTLRFFTLRQSVRYGLLDLTQSLLETVFRVI